MLASNLLGVPGLTCPVNKFLFSHASHTPVELVNKLGMLVTLQYNRTINRKSTVYEHPIWSSFSWFYSLA